MPRSGWTGICRSLPPHIPTWLLGWENTFAERFLKRLDNARFERERDDLTVAGQPSPSAGHSLVMVAAERASGNISALIASDNPQALPGLARKLPHYGKYSYLVFAGKRPDNQLKGQWPVTESPLRVPLTDQSVDLQPLQPTPLWPLSAEPAAGTRHQIHFH